MTNEELERIDKLLQASELAHVDCESEQDAMGNYLLRAEFGTLGVIFDLDVAELYAAAPAAIDALLTEVNRLRNQLQARMVLGGEFDM